MAAAAPYPTPASEPSARAHPASPPAVPAAGAVGRCRVTAPCCRRELARRSAPCSPGAPRSRRRPAALLRAGPEAARCPAADSPSAPGGLALALTSPKRHMSSLGLRNVPLPRRPVEAARLSPNARPPAPRSVQGGHGSHCLTRFGEDHVSAEVACGHWKHIWSPPRITASHLLGQRRKGVETGSSVCNLGGCLCQVGWPALSVLPQSLGATLELPSHSIQKETGAREAGHLIHG